MLRHVAGRHPVGDAHLGLPIWLVILYVIVILSACYSVIDSAFTATSSVFVVDIIKPLSPQIGEKSLYVWAKVPMFIAAIIAAGVVLTGVDFVTIVLTSYATRTAILIPLSRPDHPTAAATLRLSTRRQSLRSTRAWSACESTLTTSTIGW